MTLQTARTYLAFGCSIIPIRPGDKRPAVAWAEYQRRRPTEAEVGEWWGGSSRLGVGIVCGRLSGVVVLDSDPRNGRPASLAAYPEPGGPSVTTGSGGRHWFLATGSARVPKIPALLPGVDLQGEGSFVVAPPSVHPNGTTYRWLPGRALGEVPLPSLPFWLRRLIQLHQVPPPAAAGKPGQGAPLALAEVLAALTGVRRVAGGWVACCPVHADHEPSLSVAAGTKQAVLLFCDAGCSYPAIRAALTRESACR
jgi:hypothetical protein